MDLMEDNGDLRLLLLNTNLAGGEHIPEIERRIWVIKERVWSEKASLPYTYYPTLMIVDLISFVTMWLDTFPLSSGIQLLSICALMVGTSLSYKEHCRCLFGAYVQTHKEGLNDTDSPRTLNAICLGPTGNTQHRYKFLNLATNRCIYRRG